MDGKVAIELPYHGNASYKVDINGDLKNVSSRLPSPVSKPAGEPLPVKINVAGGLSSFDLTGSIGAKNHINSRWLLNHKLTLDRAILTTDSKGTLRCPISPVSSSTCRRWMARSGWRSSRTARQMK